MSLRRSIARLGPYPSLFLLALPTATVEPLKLAAVAVAGEGHWITGTVMIMSCYAFSLLVLERLFVIVKPKLLAIGWFAALWKRFVWIRARALWLLGGWIGLRQNWEFRLPPSRSERAARPDERYLGTQPASK